MEKTKEILEGENSVFECSPDREYKLIDWCSGRENLLSCGMSVSAVNGTEEWSLDLQERCIIRGFPLLKVRNKNLKDCIFSHCVHVSLEDCSAEHCEFSRVDTVFLDNTQVLDSAFRHIRCSQGGFAISMEDSTLSDCVFSDITLENGCYLADGVGECLVENCCFEQVSTDREDGELFVCEETTGKLLRRKRRYDMVDRDSCTGLHEED